MINETRIEDVSHPMWCLQRATVKGTFLKMTFSELVNQLRERRKKEVYAIIC